MLENILTYAQIFLLVISFNVTSVNRYIFESPDCIFSNNTTALFVIVSLVSKEKSKIKKGWCVSVCLSVCVFVSVCVHDTY